MDACCLVYSPVSSCCSKQKPLSSWSSQRRKIVRHRLRSSRKSHAKQINAFSVKQLVDFKMRRAMQLVDLLRFPLLSLSKVSETHRSQQQQQWEQVLASTPWSCCTCSVQPWLPRRPLRSDLRQRGTPSDKRCHVRGFGGALNAPMFANMLIFCCCDGGEMECLRNSRVRGASSGHTH